MAATFQGAGLLRAIWFIAACSVLLFAMVVSGAHSDHHRVLHAQKLHTPPALGHRWKRQANSTGLHDNNSTLTEAELIVKAAQEEARKRNKYIMEHVRRNRYSFGNQAPDLALVLPETGDSLASGFNQTVTDAAAILAEHIAAAELQGNNSTVPLEKRQTTSYWMANMVQNGISPYAPPGYQVWRNVRDYGAVGDGVTDDTAAINAAIVDGDRCGLECGSSTTLFAVVYFPPGTYLVSSSIVQYYFTQFIGDPTNRPTIKASPAFAGLGMISSNVYIDGGDSAEWYIPQSNFLRQVRNFILDISDAPQNDYVAAIHWQVAQATSLQNIKFIASTTPGNNQQCMFMENGSGGFLSDLEFEGGALGAYVGNQQFTVRNLKFRNQLERAIEIHWDWGWTWKGLDIANTPVGVHMTTAGAADTEVGSAIFIDSQMSNVPVGFKVQQPTSSRKISLSLFSVSLTNVPTAVQYDGGATLLAGTSGSTMIAAWGLGKRYDTTTSGEASGVWQDGTDFPRAPVISGGLLKNPASQTSGFFERSKPQYETLPASAFVNLKTGFGAVGNGVADDTSALNAAFASVASTGKILWIPAGVYIVTNTVFIPPGVKAVGQAWSQIMGAGSVFSNANAPRAVVKVGNPGDAGVVELQDLMFTVRGATAGAVVLEWNIHESSPGSAAMWDTHIRVGGQTGSDLQVANCPKLTGIVDPDCIAASMLVHMTPQSSAYFENTWFWVADHDLDIPAQTQIDIYVARGFLIESSRPTWLYGTSSEHCVLYQYQTLNAANIFMGMIQTESPYFQVAPRAPAPFTPGIYEADPTFDYCDPTSTRCAVSWGVRFINSASIYLYGAGLYSWFSEYSQVCVAAEDCQDRIFEIDGTSDVWVYSLITKASIEMISPYQGVAVLGADNHINFCSIVMAWLGGADASGGGSKMKFRSPISATVIPFPATTVPKASTFTLGGPVATDVAKALNNGNQNSPNGPGSDLCVRCDLMRLITSTCCGVGGSIGNPVVIPAANRIAQPLILPQGFIPNQPITDDQSGIMYGPGAPLPKEVIIGTGTAFPVPFNIPAGQPFSDTFTPDEYKDDGSNATLYIISDFWEKPHTVFCNYPCTLVFPPYTTTSTWTPTPLTTVVSETEFTTVFPPVTTQKIKISKTTVQTTESSSPTIIIAPIINPKPICITGTIPILDITVKIGMCPPVIDPFPPIIPIPVVTIKLPPPGTLPGPINPGNLPTPDQEDTEDDDEEDQDPDVCLFDPDYLDRGDPTELGGTGWPGGAYNPNLPDAADYGIMPDPPAAGTGNPSTRSTTVTAGTTRDGNQQPTGTVTSATTPRVPPAPTPTATTPAIQPRYDVGSESAGCYYNGEHVDGAVLRNAFETFCHWAHGKQIVNDGWLNREELYSLGIYEIRVAVFGRNKCAFVVTQSECLRVFEKVIGCRIPEHIYRSGGYVTSNCATWTLYAYLDPALAYFPW